MGALDLVDEAVRLEQAQEPADLARLSTNLFLGGVGLRKQLAAQVAVAEAIDGAFGSFADFKTAFTDAAVKHFGSGWAWLVADKGALKVMSLPNQDSPLTLGLDPILTLDVWEHAYYLKYQNRRAEFVEAFWQVVNWDEVERRLEEALER